MSGSGELPAGVADSSRTGGPGSARGRYGIDPDVRFVLVEPSHPGNVGAAARAMRVMGFSALALVRPVAFPHAEATAMAAGADDVLARARVCDTLDEALAGCTLVFGTSARRRTLGWPERDARAAAAEARAAGGPVAFVFGRERTGLANAELDRCHFMLHVPTAPDYGSINLAQAVQIVAYELRMAAAGAAPGAAVGAREPRPTHEDMERFFAHLEQALADIGFLDPDNPRQLMRRLRRYFLRSEPSAVELSILRGILRHSRTPAPDSATRRRIRDSRGAEGGATITHQDDQESGTP